MLILRQTFSSIDLLNRKIDNLCIRLHEYDMQKTIVVQTKIKIEIDQLKNHITVYLSYR